MRCPNCKTELKQDDVYCYQCGTKINWFWRFKTHLIAVAVFFFVFNRGGGCYDRAYRWNDYRSYTL